MPAQGSGDNRGGGVRGPHPHAGDDTAEAERVELHGLPEGQEQPDDI